MAVFSLADHSRWTPAVAASGEFWRNSMISVEGVPG